jgi:hypothetical protein
MLELAADHSSASFVQRLESGSATVRDIVRDIAKSSEHTQRFFNAQEGSEAYNRAVGTLYRHVLGRQPDEAGARAWADVAARKGLGPVVDDLVASPEYRQSFGDWGVPGSGGLRYCGPNQPRTAESRRAPSNMRVRGMDRNTDGMIALDEWSGNRQSFRVHDWNNDGMLSGDEVRPGARRSGRSLEDEDLDRDERFEDLDVNGNGRIEFREWHLSDDAFDLLDRNNDRTISRAEFGGRGVATVGQLIVVDPNDRWTATGIVVGAGDTLTFDAEGTVQLSTDAADVASPAGAHSGRRAPDAPLQRRPAGALIARIGNSAPIFVGARGSFRAPVDGELFLGVNDDFLRDNTGDFRVAVDVASR